MSLDRASRPSPLVWSIPMLWTYALGLWGLSRQGSMWRDEAVTWHVAQRSTAEIGHMLENIDVVHGCYYLLMHAVFEVFGPGITTLRLPSVLAMGVAAACVALIGSRLAGPSAGIAGGMVFGLIPAVQFQLQEGRPYALVAAGAGISTLLLVVVLQGRVRTAHWAWAAYAGAVALSGLLNWLSLMVLPAHLATLVWTRAGRGVWTRWTAAAAAATACVLPLVLFSQRQAAQVDWIPRLSWPSLTGPALLFAIGGVGALLDRSREGRLSVTAVGLPLLVLPQIGLAGLSLMQPVFLDRYVIYSLLGLALLIGTGIASTTRAVRSRWPRASWWILAAVAVVAVAALLPPALAQRSPASRVDDVVAVASDVRRMKEPGSAVLFIPSGRRDSLFFSPDDFAGLRDIALEQSPESSGTLSGIEAEPDRIRAAMLDQRRILVVTDTPQIARRIVGLRDRMKAAVLESHFTAVADEQVRGRRVTVYERRASPPGA
ncbi:hypothetical protein ACFVID_36775 [Streptomyces sp. NPDC127132]|uniref:glycosyltransferase family 39 protein n=1 Tax=Streptomyces sp. NPDC127132 TaxID=3345374 RepID=UPI003636AAD5